MANLSNINGKFVVEQTTGYVGIGTTNPNFLIEAVGTNAELALNASSIYRVRSTSNDEFIITKNGVGDRLVIVGGGNVGIGTSSPVSKLHVVGEARVYTGSSLGYWGVDAGNSYVYFGTNTSNYSLSFQTSGTERMRIDSGGSIIIGDGATSGTPASDYRSLEIGRQGNTITGAPWKSNLYFSTNATVTAGSTAFTYRYPSSAPTQMTMENGVFTWSNATAGTVGNTISFTERMRITSDGMVGIGMTPGTAGSSTYMLQMYNSGSQCFLAIGNGTSGNGPTNGLVIGNDANNAYVLNREATTLKFGTNDLERMFIDSSGNVGIGVTSPSQSLEISGNMAIRDTHKIYFNHNTNTNRYIGASSANDLDIAADDDINYRSNYNRFFNGSTEFARLSSSTNSWIATGSNGKLGINKTNPAYNLDVTGSIFCTSSYVRASTAPDVWYSNNNNGTYTQTVLYMNQSNSSNTDLNGYFFERGRISNSATAEIRRWVVGARGGQKQMVLDGPGTLTVAGDVVAYGSPSDKTLKKDIKPIENALSKIQDLEGVTFTWKDPSITNIVNDIGFIAQDVKKVLPTLVRENENGKLSMRHQGVIPILVEAIKELTARVEKLENKTCAYN